MKINIARFYRRERVEMDCEIITPMFLGNASQEAELRTAPFKGLLRYWWRVANGGQYEIYDTLLAAENRIFGSANADTGGMSQVTVDVEALSGMVGQKDAFNNPGLINHPECERNKPKYKTNPLCYLAGMGLIHYKKGMLHTYFPPGAKFRCTVTAGHKAVDDIQSTLGFIKQFGAIGSRSRNGWGCFFVEQEYHTVPSVKDFYEAFTRDYPHCLGKDQKGNLIWKTKRPHKTWEICMKDLADVYVSIRAGNAKKEIQGLNVNSRSRPDRHLLGYPVMNHPLGLKNWGNNGRHGSALRLLVRKEANGHRGYILHLPHLFSEKMWPNEKERQIKIWQLVHANLDTLCERVSYMGADR